MNPGAGPQALDDAGAGIHVIHIIRAENAHLEPVEARILQAAGIHGLIFYGHLRLIHLAAPHRRDIDRHGGFRSAQQPVHRLSGYLADGIPDGLLNPGIVVQATAQVLFHCEQIGAHQRIVHFLKPVGIASAAAARAAKRIPLDARFRHHARNGGTVHNPGVDLCLRRRHRDIEVFNGLDADRLGIRRQNLDGRQHLIQSQPRAGRHTCRHTRRRKQFSAIHVPASFVL